MKTTKSDNSVWMVRDNNIITLYHNKADAYRHYYDRCCYYKAHKKPTPNDLWTYGVEFKWNTRQGDLYDCNYIRATYQGGKEKYFEVSVYEKEILNNYEP